MFRAKIRWCVNLNQQTVRAYFALICVGVTTGVQQQDNISAGRWWPPLMNNIVRWEQFYKKNTGKQILHFQKWWPQFRDLKQRILLAIMAQGSRGSPPRQDVCPQCSGGHLLHPSNNWGLMSPVDKDSTTTTTRSETHQVKLGCHF